MPAPTLSLKNDIPRILAWSVALPILCVWPFVSAMPAFTLMSGGLSTLAVAINLVMVLSGFWPILAAYVAFACLRTGEAMPARSQINERGLFLGAYATLWTAIYLIVAFARP